jgi:hypothetical protein
MLTHVESLADEPIIITHGIKGYPYHFMTDRGLLQITHCPHNRTMPTKFMAKIKTGSGKRCRGYKLDGVFHSLTWIEKRYYPKTLVVIRKEELPF